MAQSGSDDLPAFDFPKAVGRPDDGDATFQHFIDKTDKDLPKELQQAIAREQANEEQVKAMAAKDPNGAAKRLLTDLRKKPDDPQAAAKAWMLGDEFYRHSRRLAPEDRTRTLRSLVKYCDVAVAALTPVSATANVQQFETTALRSDIDLGDYDAGEALGKTLLAQADSKAPNYGDVIHDTNMALAEIALKKGDADLAAQRLIAASQTPGSPQLDSAGPRFPILPDMLQAGKRDAVVAYLKNVAKFWHSDTLPTWIATLQNGETPSDYLWRTKVGG